MSARPGSRRPDPSWLTASQAAARLGVKPATLYAYVSRGLIPRRRGPDGRASYFLPADVERLAKRTPHSRLAPTDIVVPTSVSLIDGPNGALWYRGVDAIDACAKHRFETIAEFLWTGRWGDVESWEPNPASLRAARRAHKTMPRSTPPIDRLPVMLGAARAADTERGDRSVEGSLRCCRNIMSTVVDALPLMGAETTRAFAARMWARLTPAAPRDEDLRLLDLTLGLAAEHGVTLSVVAARITAASGGDPYAAIGAAFGPASAAIERSAFDDLDALLLETERTQVVPEAITVGVSTDPYPKGDPRAKALMTMLRSHRREKSDVIEKVAFELKRRSRAEVDITFATSAVSFVCGLAPGSSALITAVARSAGWMAHVLNEYRQPTPFRPHGTYTGAVPLPEQREDQRLLHAVMNYLRED